MSLSLHSVASHTWVAIAQVMALAYGRGHRAKLIELMNQKEVVGDVFNQLRLALQRRTVGRQAQVYKTLNSVSILLLSLYHSSIHCQEQGWLHLMFILFECCIFLMVFWKVYTLVLCLGYCQFTRGTWTKPYLTASNVLCKILHYGGF